MKQLKQSEIKELRDDLLQEQDNKCLICCNVIDDNACLDHQHKKRLKGTGLVRGVLCRSCNVYLGKLENNCKRYSIDLQDLPDTLRSIADYLERPHLDFIHPSEKPKRPVLSKRCFNILSKAYNEKYPKRKQLEYPKSKHLTKTLSKIFEELDIEVVYLS